MKRSNYLQEMFCANLKLFEFYLIFCNFQHFLLVITLYVAVSNALVFEYSIDSSNRVLEIRL